VEPETEGDVEEIDETGAGVVETPVPVDVTPGLNAPSVSAGGAPVAGVGPVAPNPDVVPAGGAPVGVMTAVLPNPEEAPAGGAPVGAMAEPLPADAALAAGAGAVKGEPTPPPVAVPVPGPGPGGAALTAVGAAVCAAALPTDRTEAPARNIAAKRTYSRWISGHQKGAPSAKSSTGLGRPAPTSAGASPCTGGGPSLTWLPVMSSSRDHFVIDIPSMAVPQACGANSVYGALFTKLMDLRADERRDVAANSRLESRRPRL
jgi:hypothetical protein